MNEEISTTEDIETAGVFELRRMTFSLTNRLAICVPSMLKVAEGLDETGEMAYGLLDMLENCLDEMRRVNEMLGDFIEDTF